MTTVEYERVSIDATAITVGYHKNTLLFTGCIPPFTDFFMPRTVLCIAYYL